MRRSRKYVALLAGLLISASASVAQTGQQHDCRRGADPDRQPAARKPRRRRGDEQHEQRDRDPVIEAGARQQLARQQQIRREHQGQRGHQARRDKQPPPPSQRAEEDQQQGKAGDVERAAVIVEDAEQQIGLAPPAGIADAAGRDRMPRDDNDRGGNQELRGKERRPASKGMPLPETEFANRRLHFDPKDDQHIQPESGDMAEEA